MPGQFDSGFRINPQSPAVVVAMAVVLFSVRWRIYQSQCYCWLCRGWHCDILWLCNRPSFHPLLVVLQFTLLLSSLSLPSGTQLATLYLLWQRKQGLDEGRREGALHSLHLLFWYAHYSEAEWKRGRSCYSFQVLSRYRTRVWTCFLLAMDNISTVLSSPQGPQVFCFKVWLVSD